MIILGIDPGTLNLGYSVMLREGNKISILDAGCLSLGRNVLLHDRLKKIYEFILSLIKNHRIECIVIETPFVGKNYQTFLKLGYVRGIIYLLVAQHDLRMKEYSPSQIKRAVAGKGSASKEQVAAVVCLMFPRLRVENRHDITDAVATALTGLYTLH